MGRKLRRGGVAPRNRFRIIGGRWRSRRLEFADRPDLRPTPDRLRETLFNWLSPLINGARCLDLFAGSGALGLEALSRGAGSVVFVDRDAARSDAIRSHLETLGGDDGEVVCADGRAWLAGPSQPFDLVFLDPPYASGWLPELCKLLIEGGWLSPVARIYIEYPHGEEPTLPAELTELRRSRAGAAEGALLGLRAQE